MVVKASKSKANADSAVINGTSAYAHKQASLCRCMAAQCATYWLPVIKKYPVIPTWSEKYDTNSLSRLTIEDDSGDKDDHELDKCDDHSDTGSIDVEDILDLD